MNLLYNFTVKRDKNKYIVGVVVYIKYVLIRDHSNVPSKVLMKYY